MRTRDVTTSTRCVLLTPSPRPRVSDCNSETTCTHCTVLHSTTQKVSNQYIHIILNVCKVQVGTGSGCGNRNCQIDCTDDVQPIPTCIDERCMYFLVFIKTLAYQRCVESAHQLTHPPLVATVHLYANYKSLSPSMYMYVHTYMYLYVYSS